MQRLHYVRVQLTVLMLASQINVSHIDMHLLVRLLTTILFCLQAIQLQPVITIETVHL